MENEEDENEEGEENIFHSLNRRRYAFLGRWRLLKGAHTRIMETRAAADKRVVK
jgi:hypothetical protein